MAEERGRNSLSIPPGGTSSDIFKRLLDHLYDAVYFVDTERKILYWNHAAERLTGYSAAQIVGRYCNDNLLMHTDAAGCNLCIKGCPLLQSIEQRKPLETEVFLRHRDGHRLAVSVRTMPIEGDAGEVVGAVEVFSDNSSKNEMVERAAELEQLAYLDTLTGLGNRRYAEKMLWQRLSEFERYKWPFGLLLGDVDHFKQVNDTYGHQAGDALLRMIGKTLVQSVRAFDFIGRWGGDEFICILSNVTSAKLKWLAERCRALVTQSRLPAEHGAASASITLGGTVIAAGDTIESMLARADQNLYKAKNTQRGSFCIE